MLTGKLVRVRFHRDRIIPAYLDLTKPEFEAAALSLLELFRAHLGKSRAELEEEIETLVGSDPSQLVHQGLAKLLEDRCEFDVVAGLAPDSIRETVYQLAAAQRKAADPQAVGATRFQRDEVLRGAAERLQLTVEEIEQGLLADLKSEQRLQKFKDISVERLLRRYNVSLAQAVLLRSTKVSVDVRGEPPRRYRQFCRQIKFHRLVCEVTRLDPDGYRFQLDGPLSLFTGTQKYGLQLALFLPAVLHCKQFELQADLLWGPQRKPKVFRLSSEERLISDEPDSGTFVPPEIGMFVELIQKKAPDWELSDQTEITSLGDGFWVPDYRLTHRPSGRSVLLEILGFWRRGSVERHLDRLRQFAKEPFVLAVSDQLHVDDADLNGLPASIHRFRQMPQYDEIIRLAENSLH